MIVALHDSDRTRFPNLPLMKLSAWHRAQGNTVERFIPLMNDSYDRVYSSKVFSFTPDEPNLPRGVIRGGTGYGPGPDLPHEIEHIIRITVCTRHSRQAWGSPRAAASEPVRGASSPARKGKSMLMRK